MEELLRAGVRVGCGAELLSLSIVPPQHITELVNLTIPQFLISYTGMTD